MARSKVITYAQAESRFEKAVRAADELADDPDRADEIEGMGVEEWAASKGYTIAEENPLPQRRVNKMSSRNIETEDDGVDFSKLPKTELVEEAEVLDSDLAEAEETMDEVWNILLDATNADNPSADQLLDAIEDVFEVLNEYDEDRFPIDDDEPAEGGGVGEPALAY